MRKKIRLGDCCKVISGATPKTSNPKYWHGNINWFSPKDLSKYTTKRIGPSPVKITQEGLDSCSAKIIPPGSLLLSSRAPIGHIAITTEEACTNQGFKSLIPSDDVDIDYLYFLILYNTERLQYLGTGATFKELSKAKIEAFEVSISNLPTQRKIAHRLDLIDRLRQSLRAEVAAYGALGKSLFLEMFGDPFNSANSFPKRSIVSIASRIQIGPFGAQLHKSDYVSDGVPVLNPTHIVDGKIQAHSDFTVKAAKWESLPQYHLKEGDILMGRRGEMGRCAIVEPEHEGHLCGTGSLFIRIKQDQALPLFVSTALSSKSGVKYLENEASGVTMLNLNKSIISNLQVALPPLPLQQTFATRIAEIERLKAKAEAALAEAEDLFAAVLQGSFG